MSLRKLHQVQEKDFAWLLSLPNFGFQEKGNHSVTHLLRIL